MEPGDRFNLISVGNPPSINNPGNTRLNNSLMKYCVCIYVVCYSINIKCLKKLLSYGIQKKKYIYVCYTEQN